MTEDFLQAHDWRALATSFINSTDNEDCIALMMRLHCIFGDVHKLLKCKRVTAYRFEYALRGARIDLLLFHADGGISIVELKSDTSVHSVVAGIGQLFLYEALYSTAKPKAKPPAYINKYLVSPIQGDAAQAVDMACACAGVVFLSYAPFEMISAHRKACIKEWVGNGNKTSGD